MSWGKPELDKADIVRLERKIDYILMELLRIQIKENIQMADLTQLVTEVEKVETVQDSAITLLQQLSQLIKDAGTDPEALAAIVVKLDTTTVALADAVVANTPAAP